MTVKELQNNLSNSLNEFKENIEFNFETSHNPNKEEIQELAKQTFYALNQFKDHIIKYLENK